MATPTEFKGWNVTLGAPAGRDDVQALPIMRNKGMVVSCWELSPEELEEVRQTARIYLSVMGATMIPSFIGTETEMRLFTADYGALPRQS